MPKRDRRRIPSASFETAKVTLLNTHLCCKRFLRQLRRLSPHSNVFSNKSPNIHGDMRKKNSRKFYALKYIIKAVPTRRYTRTYRIINMNRRTTNE